MRSIDTETLTSDDVTRSKKFTEGSKMIIVAITFLINTYPVVVACLVLPDFTFIALDRHPVFTLDQSFPDEPLKYAGSDMCQLINHEKGE